MSKRVPVRLVLLFNPASAGLRSLVDGILEAEAGARFQVIASDLPGLRPVVAESQNQGDAWLMFAGSREVAERYGRLQRRIPIVNLSAGLAGLPNPCGVLAADDGRAVMISRRLPHL